MMEMEGWRKERMKCKGFWRLYDIDIQEEVAVHMCGFDGIQSGNHFCWEPIGRAEVERVGNLKNEKTTCKDEINGAMVKGNGLDLEFG